MGQDDLPFKEKRKESCCLHKGKSCQWKNYAFGSRKYASYDDNSACIDINSVAKNANTEKAVYLKDAEEAEKGIELLEDYVHNQLRTPVFKEVTEAWL